MNELDSFTITFITNGLQKLLDDMDKLNKKMDSVDDSFDKAGVKGDSFFDKFGGWVLALGELAAGFIGIRDAIQGTFDVADKVLDMNFAADRVGRTALEFETLSRALRAFSTETDVGAMFGQTEALFKALNNITSDAWRLQFSPELAKELNYAGGITFTGEESDQEMIRKIIQGFEYHTKNKAWGDRDRLAKLLGISGNETLNFLGSGEAIVNKILKAERDNAYLSSQENLENAAALSKARKELKDLWDKIYADLMPYVTELVEKFKVLLEKLDPILKFIFKIINWLWDKFGEWINKASEFGGRIGESAVDVMSNTKSYSNARFAFSRLDDFINYGENYSKLGDLVQDIAKVEKEMGNAIKDTEENRMLLEKARGFARDAYASRNFDSEIISPSKMAQVYVDELNVVTTPENASVDMGRAVVGKMPTMLIDKM